MPSARLIVLAVALVFLLVIVRKFLSSWLGGPSREDEYRRLEAEDRREREAIGGEGPVCPLCGSETELHHYPHLRVWRCTRYPECRGFEKTRTAPRPRFVTDWERKKRRG